MSSFNLGNIMLENLFFIKKLKATTALSLLAFLTLSSPALYGMEKEVDYSSKRKRSSKEEVINLKAEEELKKRKTKDLSISPRTIPSLKKLTIGFFKRQINH